MRVLKFNLEVTDYQKVKMPLHSEILTVQDQNGKIALWAVCHESSMTEREFLVVGTGNNMPSGDRTYVGTVQQSSGSLVWHIFEAVKP